VVQVQVRFPDFVGVSTWVVPIRAVGFLTAEKRSQVQTYSFDPSQECKLAADGKTTVMFSHDLEGKFALTALDMSEGTLQLKP
jgi:hypothetical protein